MICWWLSWTVTQSSDRFGSWSIALMVSQWAEWLSNWLPKLQIMYGECWRQTQNIRYGRFTTLHVLYPCIQWRDRRTTEDTQWSFCSAREFYLVCHIHQRFRHDMMQLTPSTHHFSNRVMLQLSSSIRAICCELMTEIRSINLTICATTRCYFSAFEEGMLCDAVATNQRSAR